MADDKTGEAVKLFVVSSNPSLTEEDLQHFCRSQLTAYKVPRYVQFESDLPKSPAGKILCRKLRDTQANKSRFDLLHGQRSGRNLTLKV